MGKKIKNNNTRKKNRDNSAYIPQAEKIDYTLSINNKQKLTEKQSAFLELLSSKECKLVILDGPAGTAKTFISVLAGLESLNTRKTSDIVYIRTAVESTESRIGFIPGSEEDKISPYLQPLVDKLQEFLPREDIDYLIKNEKVEGKHTGYLRGLSWNAKFIIFDEAQNATMKELITAMTRIGQFSKMVIIGDSRQNDINGKSGFEKIYNIFNDQESEDNGIFSLKFDEEDIVRSGITQFIVKKLGVYK